MEHFVSTLNVLAVESDCRKEWWYLWVDHCFPEGAAQWGGGTASLGWMTAWVEDRRMTASQAATTQTQKVTRTFFF